MAKVALRFLALVLVAVAAIRFGGTVARVQRDRYLRHLVATGLTALNGAADGEAAGLVAFVDWSTLLGQWREGGIFYDEEDADLGVVLPPSLDAADVADVLREAIAGDGTMRVIEDPPGMVYLEPLYNRLHLDMYLVRRRESCGNVATVGSQTAPGDGAAVDRPADCRPCPSAAHARGLRRRTSDAMPAVP